MPAVVSSCLRRRGTLGTAVSRRAGRGPQPHAVPLVLRLLCDTLVAAEMFYVLAWKQEQIKSL